MTIIRNFLATLIGIIAGMALISLFYSFISIPLVVSIALPITAFITYKLSKNSFNPAIIAVVVTTIDGIYYYGKSVILSIIHYPEYYTIFGIFVELVNTFAILGMGIYIGMLLFIGNNNKSEVSL